MKIKICFTLLILTLMFSCEQKKMDFDDELVRNQVDSTMAAYLDALSKHDGERMASFYLDSPDFEVIANREFINHNDWVKINIDFYSGIREVKGGFSDLHTIVLGPDAVLISGVRDQTNIDTANVVIREVGAASWAWTRRNGSWYIIHINTNFSETSVQ